MLHETLLATAIHHSYFERLLENQFPVAGARSDVVHLEVLLSSDSSAKVERAAQQGRDL